MRKAGRNTAFYSSLLQRIRKEHFTILSGKNCFIQFSTRMAGWLLPTFLICLHKFCYTLYHHELRVLRVQMLKSVIHEIESKNEWLLPASFTAKFGLVFVLTMENVFS